MMIGKVSEENLELWNLKTLRFGDTVRIKRKNKKDIIIIKLIGRYVFLRGL